MSEKDFQSTYDVIKKNAHLVYAITRRNNDRMEIYLVEAKLTKATHIHVFLNTRREGKRYYHFGENVLTEIKDIYILKDYEAVFAEILQNKTKILSTHKQIPVTG